MKEKDKTNKQDISVNGHYVSEISSRCATHRIYHYQVTVGQSANTAVRNYEGELHLCEAIPSLPVADEVVPADHADNTVDCKDDSLRAVVDVETTVHSAPSPSHYPDIPVSAEDGPDTNAIVVNDVTVNKARPIILAINALGQRSRAHSEQVKNFYADRVTRGKYFLRSLSGYARAAFSLRKKIALPVLNLPAQRKIFTNKPRRMKGLAILALSLVTIGAAGIYLRQAPQTPLSLAGPAITAEQPVSQADTAAYKAVIEKTGHGVVITLQGPDHDEVLTRLPPGYSPVLEGNKVVHIVTPGNTLWFIAKRYVKNPYRYPELARLNKIPNPDLIYPGDKVIIQYLRKP